MTICSSCSRPVTIIASKSGTRNGLVSTRDATFGGGGIVIRRRDARRSKVCGGVKASMVDSHENSSDFAKRMEQAWLISQQPKPVICSSCDSNGHVECKWCAGTGFFIIGDNMLCEVPSRNTTCVICAGTGSMRCSDCKGTGFRAKWLVRPPIS